MAVIAVDGRNPSDVLQQTVRKYLRQPGASAVGVLPISAPMSSLPIPIERYQAVRYGSSICDAVSDVLTAAGIEPDERRAFLSYSHSDKDKEDAMALAEALSDQRFRVFLDVRSISAGSLWEHVLWDGLLDAALVVVLETPSSTRANWVNEEIRFAQARGAAVVAVQPKPCDEFKSVPVRVKGSPAEAGPFITDQHRLLLWVQQESRMRSVEAALNRAHLSSEREGRSIRTMTHLIGVYPRPVTLHELHRVVDGAQEPLRKAITFSPEPILAAKRDDRSWVHQQSRAIAFGDGSLWALVREALP